MFSEREKGYDMTRCFKSMRYCNVMSREMVGKILKTFRRMRRMRGRLERDEMG